MIINMEELSELTQAISKQLRNQGDYYNLVEEIADVIISIHFLKVMVLVNFVCLF